ncbi:hypothetical protein GF380_05205 [Candidatus Uhrbacteria bacterium]|nr:hypothetical protein [Candidatus Uhrbacteria bacterium]
MHHREKVAHTPFQTRQARLRTESGTLKRVPIATFKEFLESDLQIELLETILHGLRDAQRHAIYSDLLASERPMEAVHHIERVYEEQIKPLPLSEREQKARENLCEQICLQLRMFADPTHEKHKP